MEPSHVLAWARHFPVATHTDNGDAEGERNWGHAEPLQCCEPRAAYVPVGDTAAGSVLFSISAVLERTKCMCVRGRNADFGHERIKCSYICLKIGTVQYKIHANNLNCFLYNIK